MTERQYDIALVIPVYNEERYIRHCLHSVFRQSYPAEKFDIVIVDGRSTDRTREIVREIGRAHPNVRLLENPDRVQVKAFNIGVSGTDAPVVIRMDAHSTYDRNYVKNIIGVLSGDPSVGNAGGVWKVCPGANTYMAHAIAIFNRTHFGIGGAKFRVGAEAGETDTVPFGAFPRCVLEAVGPMNESLFRSEDTEYNARIRAAGFKIYLDPRIVCNYFCRPTLAGCLMQMFHNGNSIGFLLWKAPSSVRLRHLAPFLFVTGLVAIFVLGLFFPLFSWCFALAAAGYFLADLAASFAAGKRFGWRYVPALLFLYPANHIAYGAGTLFNLAANLFTTRSGKNF